jgi:recombination protein RecR
MSFFPVAFDNLVDKFASLPGVGSKSAQRLAFYIMSLPEEEAMAFGDAIHEARRSVKFCRVCQNLSAEETCSICSGSRAGSGTVCVVAEPKDVAAIERTREFNGTYHVLHGVISPIDNVGPGDIRARELLLRLGEDDISEVIMATNPTVEGDATAMYLSRLIKQLGVKVTRIAYGIPVGGDLEYADDVTLMRALEGRREL